MNPKDYSQMMAYLTRPAMARGGRIGFKNGTKNRPKISGVDFKKVISDSFEKISNQKGKVSISDIVSDTGYSKPTIYKYLSESQSAKLIGQPSPFKDKITKQVNQIIEDVFKNKKPLINASPNKIFEKIYGKKFNIKTDNTGVIKKILEENPNWPKIKDAVTNTSTRVGAGNKVFETVKFKDFDKALATAMKSRSLTRAGTVEEFILRDLKRHIDQGGTKFEFAKGNSLEKGFKGLKIKDLTKGDVIDFAAIKKDDPRFKEYKKVFNDIKKLKLTPYTNPVTKEKTTLLKGLQEATGVDAPLNIQHAKGVAVDPLKNLSIATYKANIGAKMVGSVEDVETLGVRSTIPGGKRVYGPKLSYKDEVNRLTKFADRMIKGAGTRTLKTPTETLTKTKQMFEAANNRLSANPFFSPGILKEAFKTIPTPLTTAAATAGFGVDPTSAIDRAGIAAEAAFAPALVKQSAKMGAAQRLFNLGFNPRMAMRIARVASPLGIVSLAGEGVYQAGKFAKKRIGELQAMTPEQRAELRRQGARQAFDPFQAAGGGIAKEAGDPSGAMLESMNPDSQGLPGLLKRVRNR